jgi:threonine dehydrogenase-like Zn-dependent dehydrogenase
VKALFYDNTLTLQDVPKPMPGDDEALIRVTQAGICNTDIEITRGYMPGFRGVVGHEFIGVVEEAPNQHLVGKRATAEINLACGECTWCRRGMQRHCPNRSVLGIDRRNGAFAEYLTVPQCNVVELPPSIPEDRAVFIEPLAAACEILEQIKINRSHSVLLVGDGKLGQLIGRVIHTTGCKLLAVGKHTGKLGLLSRQGIATVHLDQFEPEPFDIVIEATGSPVAFELALSCLKPRGTLVLKSTYAGKLEIAPSSLVVNEYTIIGSRCGRFSEALNFLLRHTPPLEQLITARYPLDQGLEAFEHSQSPEALKVVLEMPGRQKSGVVN